MTKKLNVEDLKKLILDSFDAERENSVARGEQLIHPDFAVTGMYEAPDGEILRRMAGKPMREYMHEVYAQKGREFRVVNIVADEKKQTVLAEFIESYPDPKTGQLYRAPLMAVCEVKDGRIYRTRHYLDPRLSYKNLSEDQINKALK